MANFYTDHPEIKFQLESNKLLERIAELKERNYADAEAFDYAPSDYADALDSYDRVCELTGDICANIIAPNAEDVDAEGPHCENGRVRYASKTYENLDATVKAGLCGVTMPRRYGGLNFPNTVYTAINEMIATADAGFENIWSLGRSALDRSRGLSHHPLQSRLPTRLTPLVHAGHRWCHVACRCFHQR